MNSTAIELYIYMNSHGEIIKWLESEGVKTKQAALDRLQPYVKSNIRDVFSMGKGTSLAGTAGCVGKVAKHFEELEKA